MQSLLLWLGFTLEIAHQPINQPDSWNSRSRDGAYVWLNPARSSSAMNLLYQRVGGSERISRLLRHFYADVRQDPLIGPIFNAKINGPSTYARPMPMKHLSLRLREDFERWLFLWQANCRAQLPSDVAKEMIDLADHISHRLRIFG